MPEQPQPAPKAAVEVDGRTIRIEVASVVPASPDDVWAVVATFAGVNDELMPFCRMVPPRSFRGRALESYVPGERAACWLLAGGIVPFDRHDLGLESVAPGAGFVEESTTWLQRRWRHERTLTVQGSATEVRDRLTLEPRVAVAARFTGPVVGRVFEHRHRRLRTRFGA